MMRTILIFGFDEKYKDAVSDAAPGFEVVIGGRDTPVETLNSAEIVMGFGAVIAKVCKEAAALKWVQSATAGVDSLPLDLLRSKGIFVTNASGVHARPISETITAMMLALTRGISEALHNGQGIWNRGAMLPEMHGASAGILGAGSIGSETARILKAFGMTVYGLRRSGAPAPNFDEMYAPEQLADLLPRCDYVINILPLTPKTRGIMNAEMFKLMKNSAYYISVGRGPTTDQKALTDALNSGTIAGAGLDVTVPEPLEASDPLLKMPNVIVTPHIAGMTPFYFERAMEIFLENLKSYIETGRPVRNITDLSEGY